MSGRELYELRPVSELRAGDLVYTMGNRYRLSGDPHSGPGLGDQWRRLPLESYDRAQTPMAPPFELDHLIPVVTDEGKAAADARGEEIARLRAALAGAEVERDRALEEMGKLRRAARRLRVALTDLEVVSPWSR
jgi:hypothetical protein